MISAHRPRDLRQSASASDWMSSGSSHLEGGTGSGAVGRGMSPKDRKGEPAFYRPVDTRVRHRESFLWRRLPESWKRRLTKLGNTRTVIVLMIVFRAVKLAVAKLVRMVRKAIGIVQKTANGAVKAAGKQKHKLKILLSMFQVMDGLQTSFNLLLPISFLQLLENLNFVQFSLPMDCLVPVRHCAS